MAGVRYPIEMVNGVPVAEAPAEIDASTAHWLGELLLQAHCCGHGTFVVDMSRTRFCDAASVGVLVQAHKRALAQGGELRLVIPASTLVLRVFAVTGIDQVIPNFPGLDEALQSAPATAPRPPLPRRRRRPKPGMRTSADRRPADPGATPSPA